MSTMPDKTTTTLESIESVKTTYSDREWVESVYGEYAELLDEIVEKDYKIELQNDSYLDALVLTEAMFRNSKKSIRMLTGSACDGFLSVIGDQFEGALSRLKENGGFAKIIVVGENNSEFLSDLMKKYSDTLEVTFATAKEGAEIEHYIACDSCMLREEEYHLPLSPGMPPSTIKANISFGNKPKTEVFEDRFESTWDFLN